MNRKLAIVTERVFQIVEKTLGQLIMDTCPHCGIPDPNESYNQWEHVQCTWCGYGVDKEPVLSPSDAWDRKLRKGVELLSESDTTCESGEQS